MCFSLELYFEITSDLPKHSKNSYTLYQIYQPSNLTTFSLQYILAVVHLLSPSFPSPFLFLSIPVSLSLSPSSFPPTFFSLPHSPSLSSFTLTSPFFSLSLPPSLPSLSPPSFPHTGLRLRYRLQMSFPLHT